jgi:predicted phosphoribosyltransferase
MERCINTSSVGSIYVSGVISLCYKNPKTPFIAAETTFLDLRNKTEDELKAMLKHLQKQFILELPDLTAFPL